MASPTPRAALLFALAALPALAAPRAPAALALLAAMDAAALLILVADALLAPRPGALIATRLLREPLSAFAQNRIALTLASRSGRPLRLEIADAPPPEFEASGHRQTLVLRPGDSTTVEYQVRPRRRGTASFGDLHVRVRGPLTLARRQWRIPLARPVEVYPDLRGLAEAAGAERLEQGRARTRGLNEGREFAALRPYLPGDDIRGIDWKATARRGAPVVREFQPERNQAVWLLLDCGRSLSARLKDGRTKLDRAVDAALALARAAALRGDRTGAILFGAEVERVVLPGAGRAGLSALADALHGALARPEEADYLAALDALEARQRRRALVVVITDLSDPDTSATFRARAALLARRHLVLLLAVADSEVAEVAASRPERTEEAYARAAAERILAERDLAAARLTAAGIRVESAPARSLVAAVVNRYLEVKRRGAL
ncbi:MAG TPA: DUF58 domain-containing protein [Anaeromyxobacter sp.]|nr:DUF58 domain-containing protein [Anaeromyxobacter sp.]